MWSRDQRVLLGWGPSPPQPHLTQKISTPCSGPAAVPEQMLPTWGFLWGTIVALSHEVPLEGKNRDQTPSFVKTNKCLILPDLLVQLWQWLATAPLLTHSPTVTQRRCFCNRSDGSKHYQGFFPKVIWECPSSEGYLIQIYSSYQYSSVRGCDFQTTKFYFPESSTL